MWRRSLSRHAVTCVTCPCPAAPCPTRAAGAVPRLFRVRPEPEPRGNKDGQSRWKCPERGRVPPGWGPLSPLRAGRGVPAPSHGGGSLGGPCRSGASHIPIVPGADAAGGISMNSSQAGGMEEHGGCPSLTGPPAYVTPTLVPRLDPPPRPPFSSPGPSLAMRSTTTSSSWIPEVPGAALPGSIGGGSSEFPRTLSDIPSLQPGGRMSSLENSLWGVSCTGCAGSPILVPAPPGSFLSAG